MGKASTFFMGAGVVPSLPTRRIPVSLPKSISACFGILPLVTQPQSFELPAGSLGKSRAGLRLVAAARVKSFLIVPRIQSGGRKRVAIKKAPCSVGPYDPPPPPLFCFRLRQHSKSGMLRVREEQVRPLPYV